MIGRILGRSRSEEFWGEFQYSSKLRRYTNECWEAGKFS
jgi:hypothetical protein